MSNLLYYVSGAGAAAEAERRLRDSGADSGIDPEGRLWSRVLPGPDNKAGFFLSRLGDSGAVGYSKDGQRWVESGEGAFWVGVIEGAVPGPKDLERPKLVGGHKVRLSDGRDWTVPVARVFPEGTRFPERLVLGPGGAVSSETLPEYMALCTRAGELFDEVVLNTGSFFVDDLDEAFKLASDALAVNYYLDGWSISALGLFTTANVIEVIEALIDMPIIVEISDRLEESKKKELESGTGSVSGDSSV